jgi:hypothetical protein
VGFLSAILFTVFSDGIRSYVDFGEKWLELSGLPYQMNTALLGFIVGLMYCSFYILGNFS